jgi:hypothetical protein
LTVLVDLIFRNIFHNHRIILWDLIQNCD